MPKNRPKLSARAIRERDGNHCQYTGACCARTKATSTTSCRSHAGADTWENLVWSSKEVNTRKGNRQSGFLSTEELVTKKTQPPG